MVPVVPMDSDFQAFRQQYPQCRRMSPQPRKFQPGAPAAPKCRLYVPGPLTVPLHSPREGGPSELLTATAH